MTCGKIRRLIDAVSDGSAAGPEREAVERHTSTCAGCARALQETQRLLRILGDAPERRVSAEFEQDLARALAERRAAANPTAWWERFRLRFEWRVRVPALVTAGSVAAGLAAVAVVPRFQALQEQKEERAQIVASALNRHRQLERTSSDPAWDLVEDSIQLSTGAVALE